MAPELVEIAAASMPRRVEVLRQLASAGLPFRVPEPLTPVTSFGDRARGPSWCGPDTPSPIRNRPPDNVPWLEAVR
ncbi:hypothetical protein SAMN05216553_12122 [Lentzea fradiae]|uniref:Uncharacterized protein n=1 Tax=Lentzea fradiae TaxID=200378 RepID=A0A1G8C5A2_9PSEU|nr:hypothetical protein [Lentzea fradiae]SDH40677.1 hypothetical protein SAMN05216553_12122 [Lentzea fradiae]